jgi:ATP-dependent NAD(P)H-hydrate dehydratase
LLPKLDISRYKGQNGKVAVIGGSKEYSGAPFYAAVSALRSGADLSYVYCPEEAAGPIKSYSPEIIVLPYLTHPADLIKFFPNAFSLVIGPGLGREESMASHLDKYLAKIENNPDVNLVGDADFLWYLSNSKKSAALLEQVKKMGKRAILTPNKVEFDRLWKSQFEQEEMSMSIDDEMEFFKENKNTFGMLKEEKMIQDVAKLATKLNNVIILRKGLIDIISNGNYTYFVAFEGSRKRCGG